MHRAAVRYRHRQALQNGGHGSNVSSATNGSSPPQSSQSQESISSVTSVPFETPPQQQQQQQQHVARPPAIPNQLEARVRALQNGARAQFRLDSTIDLSNLLQRHVSMPNATTTNLHGINGSACQTTVVPQHVLGARENSGNSLTSGVSGEDNASQESLTFGSLAQHLDRVVLENAPTATTATTSLPTGEYFL